MSHISIYSFFLISPFIFFLYIVSVDLFAFFNSNCIAAGTSMNVVSTIVFLCHSFSLCLSFSLYSSLNRTVVHLFHFYSKNGSFFPLTIFEEREKKSLHMYIKLSGPLQCLYVNHREGKKLILLLSSEQQQRTLLCLFFFLFCCFASSSNKGDKKCVDKKKQDR